MLNKFLFLILLALVTAAPKAFAENETKTTTLKSVVNLFGITFSYGSPPWTKNPVNALKESKFYKNKQGPSFVLEAIPVDETFESWKTMYAVKARSARQNTSLTAWEDQTLSTFKKACQGVRIKYLVMDINVSLAQIVCPKVANFNLYGYDNGVGEVGLFAFLKHGGVFISNYIEWRGDAFDAYDRESWPVDEEQLKKAVVNLKKARAFKGQRVVSFK